MEETVTAEESSTSAAKTPRSGKKKERAIYQPPARRAGGAATTGQSQSRDLAKSESTSAVPTGTMVFSTKTNGFAVNSQGRYLDIPFCVKQQYVSLNCFIKNGSDWY